MDEKLRQIREFERQILARSSTRTTPFAFGTAYFNLDFPISYAHNFLDVEDAPPSISAQAVSDIADRLQGEAGLEHRSAWVRDDALGARLDGEFDALGWSWRNHLVVMVAERSPDRLVDTSIVEEVDYDSVRPTFIEMTRREPWADSEKTVAMLVDRRALTAQATNLRHFAVRDGDRFVSVTDMYSDGTIAQIEDVGTLDEFRGKGYARAVVSKALAVARAEGHEIIWLVADDDDWPKELYAKLGFVPADRYWEFTLPGKRNR